MTTTETSEQLHETNDDEFAFKYVPVKDFKRLVKSVRRQREKKREDAHFEKVMRMRSEKEEEEELARRMALLSPRGPSGDGDFRLPQYSFDEEDQVIEEIYEDDDFEDEELEDEIPVLKGRVIQSARSENSQPVSVTLSKSIPQTEEVQSSFPPLDIQISHEHGDSPDIPVQFVQHSHRSYVRKVEDACSVGRSWASEAGGGGEDVARMEEQFGRMRSALNGVMNGLRNYIDDGLADDQEAMARVRKRAAEFSTRFTRNYLCELRRQMGDVKRGTRSGRLGGAVQTATQALAALEKASPGIFLDTIPPPVHEFLTDLTQLAGHANEICCGDSPVIQEVEEMSCQLDSILLDFRPRPEKKKSSKKSAEKRQAAQLQKKKKKKDQYFMYRTNLNCFERAWKKRTQSLARTKFGNLPDSPLTKVPPKSAPKLEKAFDGTGGGGRARDPKMAARSRPRRNTTAIKESEVTTMMDSLPPLDPDTEIQEEKKNVNGSSGVQCRSQPILSSAMKSQKEETIPVVDEAVKTMLTDIMSEVLQQASTASALPRSLVQ